MKYTCRCTPTQEYPHIVKSYPRKTWFYSFKNLYKSTPYYQKNFILGSLTKRLGPAKSCDNHPIPYKRFLLRVGSLCVEFGKIVY